MIEDFFKGTLTERELGYFCIALFLGVISGACLMHSTIDKTHVAHSTCARDKYMMQQNYVWNNELYAYIKVEKFSGFKECCR